MSAPPSPIPVAKRPRFLFAPAIVVALAAAAVISPMLFLGNASGHDFTFHAQSWMEVSREWREGIFLPRWAAEANFGFGEPRFIFYPPASWMLGALLGTLLPWKIVPGVFIWLALFFAGFSMFRLAREWLPRDAAAAAAILFAFNPYNLVIVYYRSDFAELLAWAIFPLAVLAVLRVARQGWRPIYPLAATLAAIWLSNAPAAVLASYSLALLLFVACAVQKHWKNLLPGAAGFAGGLGLAAFYMVPAAWEQRWVNIRQALDTNLQPAHNFLFAHSSDPNFVRFNSKVSCVAVAVIAVTLLAFFAARRPRSASWRASPEFVKPLAALASLSIFMMLPFTEFAWRLVPKLEFVQFPWRWLGPLAIALAAFFAAATRQISGGRWRWAFWLAMALALAFSARLMIRDAWWDSQDIPQLAAAFHSGAGYEGADEYQPLGCDRTDLPENFPRVRAEEGFRVRVDSWRSEVKTFSVDSPRPATLELRLVNYPAWRAEMNGREAPILSKPGTMQALLRVPAGLARVAIRFRPTTDRLLGNSLSILSLFLLAVFWLRAKFLALDPNFATEALSSRRS
ncbi:MAG: 6-pyruvoyl-tetrahydropterin synthase-related protein [Candidatus Acidiferrales bacterium]